MGFINFDNYRNENARGNLGLRSNPPATGLGGAFGRLVNSFKPGGSTGGSTGGSMDGRPNTTASRGRNRGYTTPSKTHGGTTLTPNPNWVNNTGTAVKNIGSALSYVFRDPSGGAQRPNYDPLDGTNRVSAPPVNYMQNLIDKFSFGNGSSAVDTNRRGDPLQPNTQVGADNQFTFTSTLKNGSKGDEVKALQSMLGINADGIFGPQTKAAVIAFQKANGLTADGIVGKNTIAALTGNPVGSGVVSSGSESTSTGGGTNTSTGGINPATAPVEEPGGGITGDFVGQVTPNMPEFNFDYEQQAVPTLEELIALAAQQLDPHYASIGEKAGETNKQALQGIENDAIRRGMGRDTDLGNRSDQQNESYQRVLTDLERQKETDKIAMAKGEHDRHTQNSRQDYNDNYNRAVDDYARQFQMWQAEHGMDMDKHGMDMDKQTMDLKRQEVKNMLIRNTSGGSGGSSSNAGESIKLAGDRTTFNRALENATSVFNDFMNSTISRQDALDYARNTLKQVQGGAYNSDLSKSLEELISNFMKEIGSSKNTHEQKAFEDRKK